MSKAKLKLLKFPRPKLDMPPKKLLREMAARDFTEVIIIGYENGDMIVRSSSMTHESANWLLDKAKMHALGYLERL